MVVNVPGIIEASVCDSWLECLRNAHVAMRSCCDAKDGTRSVLDVLSPCEHFVAFNNRTQTRERGSTESWAQPEN